MSELTRREAAKTAAAGAAALAVSGRLAADEPQAGRAQKERGSTKLFEQLAGKKTAIDTAELRKLVASLEKEGIHIPTWWIYGTPAIDVITGTVQVPIKQIGSLVKGLYIDHELQHLRPNTDVFPLGTPKPDQLLVELRIQGG